MLPKEPDMLLSMINMKLRDTGLTFTELCEELDEDSEEIEAILNKAGYHYIPENNFFH